MSKRSRKLKRIIPPRAQEVKTVSELLSRDDVNHAIDALQTIRSEISQVLILARKSDNEYIVIDSNLDPGDFLLLVESAKFNLMNQDD